jgi:hypothetical protein
MTQETNRENMPTLVWSQQMKPDKTIPDNKPDSIVRCNEK